MSKKILSPIGSLLFGKKKKKEAEPEAATAAARKGPIITPLGGASLTNRRPVLRGGTILGLSDRLGG